MGDVTEPTEAELSAIEDGPEGAPTGWEAENG
jgi:hypothetical protein